MKRFHSLKLILLLSFFIPSFAYASSGDSEVAAWTQSTMLKTLSADFINSPSATEEIRKCYYPAAWDALNTFFYTRLQELRAKPVVLHPYAVTQPTLVSSGKCARFRCWRIEQAYRVPELHKEIIFSLLVIDGKDLSAQSPYIIESLSFTVNSF